MYQDQSFATAITLASLLSQRYRHNSHELTQLSHRLGLNTRHHKL